MITARLSTGLGAKVGSMAPTPKPETFEEIVDWAYRTLPSKIRDLPDFPGIQVVDEPPAKIFSGTIATKELASWN